MSLVILANGNVRIEIDGRVWYLNEAQVRRLRSELNRALQKYAEVKPR
jgi:hypothetical protein